MTGGQFWFDNAVADFTRVPDHALSPRQFAAHPQRGAEGSPEDRYDHAGRSPEQRPPRSGDSPVQPGRDGAPTKTTGRRRPFRKGNR